MSACRELERLLTAGREADFALHRASCPTCGAIAREMESFAATVAGLRRPSAGPALRESLYAIPRQTVSCEAAPELLAQTAENEISTADAARLQNHLSRCPACTEAAGVLGVARELATPEPAPWLSARVLAARSKAGKTRSRSAFGWLFGPRGAIAVAYAAALIVMFLGLNPADLARKAGTARLEQTARAGVQVARNTVVDQFGAFQERAFRSFEAVKGRVGGYGRAALSNALAFVMRTESSRRPSRPRNEDGSGAWKSNETEIWTWRAEGSPGGQS
jgi:hypothetical protein